MGCGGWGVANDNNDSDDNDDGSVSHSRHSALLSNRVVVAYDSGT